MKQPKIKIKKEPLDHYLEATALLALAFLLIYPAFHYESLPEEVPVHFDISGKPDSYGGKLSVLLLPVIGIFIFGMFYFIQKVPHTFNYGVKITEENAAVQYKIALRMMRTINAIILLYFAYISYSSVQIALGNATGMGSFFTVFLLVGIFGVTAFGIFKSINN